MTLLLALFGRIGVPAEYRRLAILAALTCAALIALIMVKRSYDHRVIARHQTQVEARASTARSNAEAERASDAAVLGAYQKDLAHAVDTAPQGGMLSPAAHALACERLRKLGRVPAACRSGSAD